MARRSWGLGKRRQARLRDTDYEKVIGEYGSSISPSAPPSGQAPFGVTGSADSDEGDPNPYLPAPPLKGRAARQAARAAKNAATSTGAEPRSSTLSPFEAPPAPRSAAQRRADRQHKAQRRQSAHRGVIDRKADEELARAEVERATTGNQTGSLVPEGRESRRRLVRPGQIVGVLAVALITPVILLLANPSDRNPGPMNPVPSGLDDPTVLWSFDRDDLVASRKGLSGSDKRFESVFVSQGVVIARFDDRGVDGVIPSTVVGLDQGTGDLLWSFVLNDARCAPPRPNASGTAAPTASGEPGAELVCAGTRGGQRMIEVREVATGEMLTDLDVDFPRVSGINVTSTGIQLIGQLDSETSSMELAWFDLSGTQIWRVDLAAIVPIDQYANAVDDEYLAMPLRWFALDDDRAVIEVGDAIFHLDASRAASLGDCRQPTMSQGLFLCPSDRGFEARGADGELVWTNPMAGMFIEDSWGEAAPVVSDYAEPRGTVSAIDWATGELGEALVELPDAPYLVRMGSPEAGYVSGGRDLLGLSADGKSVAWLANLPVDYVTSANLVGDKVVVDAESKGVYVLDPATGDEISRWSSQDRLAAVAGDSMVTIGPRQGVSLISFD